MIDFRFHVGDILLYVIRPSSCQVVQLFRVLFSHFIIYEVYTTC